MMTLNSTPDYLMKCMHKCQLHIQEERKPNNSSENDTTGQPGDEMLRDMYEIVRSVEELRTLGIVPQASYNRYPLQSVLGSTYPWTSALSQLTRKDTTLH